jgi:mannose-1-phosphate guanylyltransferase
MKVLLLAAGFGTRLMPLTEKIPKCLVPICGIPLLKLWIDKFIEYGIDRIFINTHYLFENVNMFIEQTYNDDIKHKITLLFEEELLGTAGTIKKNSHLFNEDFLIVIHADNLSQFSVIDFINAHKNREQVVEITMMTFNTDSPETCGIVEINNNNIVVNFFEKIKKPPSTLANAAVYIFQKSVIDFISKIEKSEIDISKDVLPHYINKIATFQNEIYHRDIGTLESFEQAQIDYNFYFI